MRFLADQDVYASTLRFLVGLRHDVIPAAQAGLARAEDVDLLRTAHEKGRIFVTRDRDFGSLVFVERQGPGVIYLRVLPSTDFVALHRAGAARLFRSRRAGTASHSQTAVSYGPPTHPRASP
jgi:predicted nuclease of predicted toxin-antitoxin system